MVPCMCVAAGRGLQRVARLLRVPRTVLLIMHEANTTYVSDHQVPDRYVCLHEPMLLNTAHFIITTGSA
jgi:hypothetical protein